MPAYDYQCRKCGRVFEVSQGMTDPPIRKCIFKKCGGKVTRLISPGASVIFKGSGFYATDYRQKREAEKTEDKPCPAAESKICPNAANCPAAKK